METNISLNIFSGGKGEIWKTTGFTPIIPYHSLSLYFIGGGGREGGGGGGGGEEEFY